MYKRIVYYGPINNNTSNILMEKAKAYLKENKGDRFYYILPNGKLLTKYKEDMLKDTVGAFDINLFTFDNIIDNLLEREMYTFIGTEVQESIVEKILAKLCDEGKIKYYNSVSTMEGFIKSVSHIIGEIKRSLISPEVFDRKIPNNPFYKEIGLVYEEYENFLSNNKLLDVEEAFFVGLKLLKNNNEYFNDLDFMVIDDFFDFRPQEIQVLEEIMKYPLDVYINIPYKRETEFSTVVNTLEILKEMGFKIEEVYKEEENNFEIMGNMLFSQDKPLLPKNSDVKIISAVNKYFELKRITQEIKSLYNKGIELKDMGIVLTNIDEYEKTLFDVFSEEGIPSSTNEEMRLIDVPLIKEFLNIIKVKLYNYQKESVIKRIKNSYFSVYSSRDKDKVEYILYKLSFRDIDDLKDILEDEIKNTKYSIDQSIENEKFKERYEWLSYLVVSLNEVIDEGNSIKSNGKPEELIDSLKRVINSYNLPDKILQIYNEANDYNIFHRDISAISKLIKVLDTMKKEISIIYDLISIEEFYEIFLRYLEEETIIITNGNRNGVNILTPSTIQGVHYSVLFITGLVEGKYPALKESNFFFREENYEIFCDIGLKLKNYYEKLDKESLLFVIAVTRCSELLYLSYPKSTMRDEVNIPSMFLDELISIFEGEEVDEINVDMDYLIKDNIKEITTESEYINHILYRYFEGDDLTEYFHMYNNVHENVLDEISGKIKCEVERTKDEFNSYSGNIGTAEIIEDIKEYHKGVNYSITYFETYGKCPYKFLMDQILKLEGMDRFMEEFSPLDRGNIFHSVLKDYYTIHKNEISNHIQGFDVFSVVDTLDEIREAIRVLIVNNGVKEINKLWSIRIENMANSIVNLVKMDLDRLSNLSSKMIPIEFEVPFGFKEDFSICIDGDKTDIIGKIDRIDKVVGEEKYILYDYKTSSYGIKKIGDMLEGISFQLPVYIMSQGDRDVIGGGYITITSGEVSMEIVKENEKETFGIKRKGKYLLNDEDWNSLMENVVKTMNEYLTSIFEGDFSINPKQCDVYCDYSSICRYKGNRR